MRLLLLAPALLASAQGAQAPGPAAGSSPRILDRVVLISVDGLRSDALVADQPETLPAFARLCAGSSTLNARTDPDFTVTLPNHTCMLTGRPALGPDGHAWVENDEPREGMNLHKNRGGYVAGIFDVAHDRGLRTALFAGKSKFSLYEASWSAENGAEDAVGEDQGRRKIDDCALSLKASEVADGVLKSLRAGAGRCLVFAHFAELDLTAHSHGWDVTPGSRYMKSLAAIDREIGRILDAILGDPSLRGTTAVLLTADHGGGAPFRSHDQPRMWVDYIIPFLVWTGEAGETRDLYALNRGTRADPGLGQPSTAATGLPPIRNGDAGNLALALLGLPPVPGSTINARQDLRITPPP